MPKTASTQTIKYFTRETDLPLTIGLLVDVSGSQRNLIEIERRAAFVLLQRAEEKGRGVPDQLRRGFGTAAGHHRLAPLLQDGLNHMKLNAGFSGINSGPVPTMTKPRGTVLYDAVYLAANDMLAKEVGRKAIVLITDGEDEGSKLSHEGRD